MERMMMKSKLHRVPVLATNLNYVGSITIGADTMQEADILPYEQVHVVNTNNGARFETYAIEGEEGLSGVELNGAAARLAEVGDIVIVISYGLYREDELPGHNVRVTTSPSSLSE
jgi:aspartate 1-decarboxylase